MASRRLAELKFSGTRSLAPISMSNASLERRDERHDVERLENVVVDEGSLSLKIHVGAQIGQNVHQFLFHDKYTS